MAGSTNSFGGGFEEKLLHGNREHDRQRKKQACVSHGAERAVVSTLALCIPVFFAGIIFISSFARASFRGSALGSDLFGWLLGGLLESSSLWFGLRSLTILAAILYVDSAIFLRRDPISHSDVS
jgi:hypothetical protein